jgi:hypothetical protein
MSSLLTSMNAAFVDSACSSLLINSAKDDIGLINEQEDNVKASSA